MSDADLCVGRPANPNMLELRSPDEAYSWFWATAQPGNPTPPHNLTLHAGYNVDGNGNPVATGEPAVYDSWEGNFFTGSQRYVERHWQYRSGDGLTSRRMLSSVVNRADHTCIVEMHGKIVMQDSTGVMERLILDDSQTANVNLYLGEDVVGGAVTLSFARNNVVMVQGKTVGGANYGQMLLLNGGDEVVVGGGAFTTGSVLSGHVRMGSSVEATLTGNVNDYSPSGGATAYAWLLDGGAADRTITGIANPGGNFGNQILLVNIGTTNSLVLTHEDTASLPSNRIKLRNATSVKVPPQGIARLYFRGSTLARWYVQHVEGQMADVGALVDNIGGTLSRTLAAIPDPADLPITADALRDDFVSNVLPKLRDALSSIVDFCNDLRAEMRATARMG